MLPLNYSSTICCSLEDFMNLPDNMNDNSVDLDNETKKLEKMFREILKNDNNELKKIKKELNDNGGLNSYKNDIFPVIHERKGTCFLKSTIFMNRIKTILTKELHEWTRNDRAYLDANVCCFNFFYSAKYFTNLYEQANSIDLNHELSCAISLEARDLLGHLLNFFQNTLKFYSFGIFFKKAVQT